jgi:sulfite reductase beta subunit-like hemoprotein
MNRLGKTLFAGLALLVLACTAQAEQAARFGDVEIHYNAMPTDELLPDVAKRYKIERSRNRGMITLSVLRKTPLGVNQPVKAAVKVTLPMLTGQTVDVPVREVVEGTAIYYIGEFRITPPQTLRFQVSATPEGGDAPLTFEFQQAFYR